MYFTTILPSPGPIAKQKFYQPLHSSHSVVDAPYLQPHLTLPFASTKNHTQSNSIKANPQFEADTIPCACTVPFPGAGSSITDSAPPPGPAPSQIRCSRKRETDSATAQLFCHQCLTPTNLHLSHHPQQPLTQLHPS